MVLSPVAARKAVNFKNKSRSGSSVVPAPADRPPAAIGIAEQEEFPPHAEGFLRQRDDLVHLCVRGGSGFHPCLGCVNSTGLGPTEGRSQRPPGLGPGIWIWVTQFRERRRFRWLEASRVVFWGGRV